MTHKYICVHVHMQFLVCVSRASYKNAFSTFLLESENSLQIYFSESGHTAMKGSSEDHVSGSLYIKKKKG